MREVLYTRNLALNRAFSLFLFLFLPVVTIFPQTSFSGLSSDERSKLDAGDALTRIAKNADTLAIPRTAPAADALIGEVRSLKPNYLVETMAVVDEYENDLGIALVEALSRPDTWLGIPYYSQRKGKRYDLFDKCQIRSTTIRNDETLILDVLHHMLPFDDYASNYELKSTSMSVIFSGRNASPLIYKGIKAVEPGRMVWRISAWKEGKSWYFYGMGAVKAFDLFGTVRDRLEPSFIGRTEAFFDYMRSRLESARKE